MPVRLNARTLVIMNCSTAECRAYIDSYRSAQAFKYTSCTWNELSSVLKIVMKMFTLWCLCVCNSKTFCPTILISVFVYVSYIRLIYNRNYSSYFIVFYGFDMVSYLSHRVTFISLQNIFCFGVRSLSFAIVWVEDDVFRFVSFCLFLFSCDGCCLY